MPNSQGASYTIIDSTVDSKGKTESGSFAITITPVTAVNIAAQVSALSAFETAVKALILGEYLKKQMDVFNNTFSPAIPSDGNCQKENKWLVRYHDATTGKKYRITIPTANLDLLPVGPGGVGKSEFLPLDSGVGATFKTQAEAVMQAPDDPSHEIVIDTVQYVSGQ